MAAGRLTTLYRIAGEYDAAMPLLTETHEYFTSIEAWVRVGTARERIGMIYLAQHRVPAAIREFTEMRRLSALAADPEGIAYADLWTCQAQIELNDFGLAFARCQIAERGLKQVDPVSSGDAAMLEAEFGRIALGMKDPAAAPSASV